MIQYQQKNYNVLIINQWLARAMLPKRLNKHEVFIRIGDKMKQKNVNGWTLIGVALTVWGIFNQKPEGLNWLLLVAGVGLFVLGIIELSDKKKRN